MAGAMEGLACKVIAGNERLLVVGSVFVWVSDTETAGAATLLFSSGDLL